MMQRLALAVRFLTIVPWPSGALRQPADLGGSMVFYPLVGAILASALAGVYGIGGLVFPEGVLRPAVILLLILITGGLHLDGVADVCDGFYAGTTKADVLRIMKDPHVGSMAVVGIVSVLLTKVVLLSHLPSSVLYSALLVFPAVSRCGMVWGTWMAPYARSEGGTGQMFFQTLQRRHVWLATAFVGLWAVLCAGWSGLILLLFAAAATTLWVAYCHRRIGGMTGDTLGALNEWLEIVTLAAYFPLGRWYMSPAPLVSSKFLW
jgi:cobalamin 5'-phosphate synthase/cobalamin synthase